MYLVVIAWLYVTMMMAVAEATATTGTVLGALFTFVLYGLLPAALVAYLLAAPARSRAIKARDRAERAQASAAAAPPSAGTPDAGGHAPGAAEPQGVAPVREEP